MDPGAGEDVVFACETLRGAEGQVSRFLIDGPEDGWQPSTRGDPPPQPPPATDPRAGEDVVFISETLRGPASQVSQYLEEDGYDLEAELGMVSRKGLPSPIEPAPAGRRDVQVKR